MSLIDKTYFFGEVNIASLQLPTVQTSLTLLITKRETEYLQKVLGYSFWKLFNAGISDVSGRWFDLKGGAEYENSNDYTKKWTGFTNSEKISPISNYIYYWYQRENVTFTAGAGEMEGKSDNATTVSPNNKIVRAWNEMVSQTELLQDYLLYKKDEDGELVYPEFAIEETECIERINAMNI